MLNKIIIYTKKYLKYSTDRWWILQLVSILLIVLSILFKTLLLTQMGVLLIIVSIIDQFSKSKWKIGLMLITIWLSIVGLGAYWLLTNLFPTREGTHKEYAEHYEKRSEIQRIIGVEIPKFKIAESKLTHYQDFDFEFEVQSKIEFDKAPDLKFFNTLDSICSLPVPTKPNESSSYFYYGIESIQRCWSKDSINYKYIRSSDSRPKFLHSSDAYFIFEIKKGSKIAEIAYGNY